MPGSRKNIDFVLHDIRPPVRRVSNRPPPPPKRDFPKRGIFIGALIALVLMFGGYGLYSSGFPSTVTRFQASIVGLFDVGGGESAGSTKSVDSGVENSFFSLFGKLGDLITIFKEVKGSVAFLGDRGFDLMFSGGGEELIANLKNIDSNLKKLDELGVNSSEYVSRFGVFQMSGAPPGLQDFNALRNGLSGLVSFLDTNEPRRLIILFENQSEIRPSGGFTGSYAEVVLDRGSITDINVDDIYFPDRRLSKKIIPPIQLQSITGGWGARDANWFFDFPTSAEKALELLEASDVYASNEAKFDGVIAFNSRMVEDILGIVGPIDVPEYNVVLDKDNFLYEVRDEVESSRDENPRENPKKILSAMTPILLERIKNLDDNGKKELVAAIFNRVSNKDLRFYFRESDLQTFIEGIGFAGTVYNLPNNFSGDYLAVVNTNVAGGKSDIFINQNIALSSRIDATGVVNNELYISRRHFGENEREPLYRARNQNFIKIFTVPGALLESIEGVTPKEIKPLVNYSERDYIVDPVLSALENTREILKSFDAETYIESGKKVFAAWFSTDAGETNELTLQYTAGNVRIEEGMQYTFIFEKQSGVESEFAYSVEAPPGFVWRESGESVFRYSGSVIPGRFTATLTLVKDE